MKMQWIHNKSTYLWNRKKKNGSNKTKHQRTTDFVKCHEFRIYGWDNFIEIETMSDIAHRHFMHSIIIYCTRNANLVPINTVNKNWHFLINLSELKHKENASWFMPKPQATHKRCKSDSIASHRIALLSKEIFLSRITWKFVISDLTHPALTWLHSYLLFNSILLKHAGFQEIYSMLWGSFFHRKKNHKPRTIFDAWLFYHRNFNSVNLWQFISNLSDW